MKNIYRLNTTSVAKTGHEHGNLKINTANVVPMAYMYTNVASTPSSDDALLSFPIACNSSTILF